MKSGSRTSKSGIIRFEGSFTAQAKDQAEFDGWCKAFQPRRRFGPFLGILLGVVAWAAIIGLIVWIV